ncbi:hypothetical protein, partial [Streptomyces sp. ME18-1-4]|uniref:hypothetical protein n=1 Tax=Streptomyces sp. ME18-1-4 TaxID=3028685 RepID=UPI0029BAE215
MADAPFPNPHGLTEGRLGFLDGGLRRLAGCGRSAASPPVSAVLTCGEMSSVGAVWAAAMPSPTAAGRRPLPHAACLLAPVVRTGAAVGLGIAAAHT